MREGGTARETFGTRLGTLAAMIGVAVGLGNVWRFPYMVGRFGGAAFVLLYLAFALLIGVPALMAEWTLGRWTRRGSVGAYQKAGVPGGRAVGWILFAGVTAATGYYCNAIGWVLFHALGAMAGMEAGLILPPDQGFSGTSFLLQILLTGTVILGAVTVLLRGVRRGIEGVSRLFTPLLFLTLLLLIARSLTLPGAGEGLRWFIMKFRPEDITAGAAMAAMGQVVFSVALGGTFMVVYGSYLNEEDDLRGNALLTVVGDTTAGLLAGLAIFPAVLALGMEPGSGPGLIFSTLPEVFRSVPAGGALGLLFFLALGGVAFLSAVAAFEVLVAGITDNTDTSRKRATWVIAAAVFLVALPPMVNMAIFLPWDLAFGSGLQSAGVLVAVLTVGWAMDRGAVLGELTPREGGDRMSRILLFWIRWVIPVAILAVGVWWFVAEVLPLIVM